MKKGVRTTLVVSAFCLLALVFLVIRELNAKRIGQLTCAGVKVEFTDDFNFVTAKDIEGYLKEEYGAYIGQGAAQRVDPVRALSV